jgi:hypothetical protein
MMKRWDMLHNGRVKTHADAANLERFSIKEKDSHKEIHRIGTGRGPTGFT